MLRAFQGFTLQFMTICIIGVGLIGGSLSLALKETGVREKIVGVDRNSGNLKKAQELGIIDESLPLGEALKTSDVIILTIPVDGLKRLLPEVLDRINENQIVIEMGSTKEEILKALGKHPNRGRLVAAHPMAGTEYSGPEAAVKDLFAHKTMVFTNVTDSDEDALDFAETLAEKLSMKTVFMNAKEHDLHSAYISHISHLTSFALALTVLRKEKSHGRIFELAGGGFESTVRLAKSSSEMWVPIFEQNRQNILEVLQENIVQLQNIKEALEREDYEMLTALVRKANKIKRILK